MTPSITRRLLSSSLVILIAFLGLAGVALDQGYRSSSEAEMRERLQAHVYTLLAAADEDEAGRMRLPTSMPAPGFNQTDSGLYAVVRGEAGDYRWRSASLLGRDAQLWRAAAPGEIRYRFDTGYALIDQGIAWEQLDGTSVDYAVTVAIERTALDAGQRNFRTALWQWLGGVAALLLLTQLLLARWGLRPLRDMAEALRRVEHGDAMRLEGPVANELAGLVNGLNALIEQNRRRQERVRNRLSDLAHSLKTPLAVLRGIGEQAQDRALGEAIVEQTARIDDIVVYQRQRAAVAGASGVIRATPLRPVIERICSGLTRIPRYENLQIGLEIDAGHRIRADEGDLYELFGNVLENAFRHANSSIRVTLTTQAATVEIRIEDDGPGFTSGDRERLLRRGERADQQHPGEGIGLAVVDEIVAQYDGNVVLGRSALGGGCVSVQLPL